jgi:hypothetical protein
MIVQKENLMKKHFLLIILIFIGFISCEPDGPESFGEIKWGMNKDKVINILNQNNIDILDFYNYIQIKDTFYGIENCQIEYHFKNNKFYKGKVYQKGEVDFIPELLTISENFISDMDIKYRKKHLMTKFNENKRVNQHEETFYVNSNFFAGFNRILIFDRCYG